MAGLMQINVEEPDDGKDPRGKPELNNGCPDKERRSSHRSTKRVWKCVRNDYPKKIHIDFSR